MGRETFITCDGPACAATLPWTGDGPYPWFGASMQVVQPQRPCEDEGCGGYMQASAMDEIDACSLACLRAALAVQIAELTDEHAEHQ